MKKFSKRLLAVSLATIAAALMVLVACSPKATVVASSTTTSSGIDYATDVVDPAVSTPVVATATTKPTMNKHASMGVTCAQCHGMENPTSAPTSDASCLSCHDYTKLVASTASYEDLANRSVNPHDSHMHGASCMDCHSNHGESKLACNDCHVNEYSWLVP